MCIIQNLSLQRLRDLSIRLVVGTEVTWKQKVDAGIFDETKLVELMVFAHAILGHTPKTHTYLYGLDLKSEMNFVEFPLGLLEAKPLHASERLSDSSKRTLGMVLPQPGRLAKGEELHRQIVELMSSEHIKQNWDLVVLNPPYSSQEFTDFAAGVDLMVNTSLGETFSYQIQEARALETPVLHPTSTYISRRGEDYIECWPEFGLDFSNLEELESDLQAFYNEPDLLDRESARQGSLAREYFSLEELGRSFRKLYSEEPLGNCQVIFSCGHSIEQAESSQLKCCDKVHTIVFDNCSGSKPVSDFALQLQRRFTTGHASHFDQNKKLIYRRATLSRDADGVWTTVSNDSVWGITLDQVKVAAREAPENPGLFERMLLRLARASRILRLSC